MIGSAEFASSGLVVLGISYAVVLAIPGPSFMVVSDAAISHSRRSGILTAGGIASGAALLMIFTLQGGALLPRSEELAGVSGLLHSLVLFYLGSRALQRVFRPCPGKIISNVSLRSRWFAVGVLTAATNPVSFAFFSSVVLNLTAKSVPVAPALLPTAVFVMAGTWFSLIAILLSIPSFRTLYIRAARTVDATMGTLLVALALVSAIS